MSSSRHRRDSDARRDSFDDYQRRDSYQRNGYGDGYGGSYDRDGYGSRDYYDDKVIPSRKSCRVWQGFSKSLFSHVWTDLGLQKLEDRATQLADVQLIQPRSNERRHRSPDDRGPRPSSHHGRKDRDEGNGNKALDKVKHSFGASEESYVATGVGAVAGAFLGSEATKGKKNAPMATLLGAVLGGLSANAIDKQYEL